MTPAERSTLKQAGEILTRLRIASPAEGLVVSLAAHSPDATCSEESYSVGVLWNGRVWTGRAIDFANAVGIARAKIADGRKRLAKEAEKRGKAPRKTVIDLAHGEVA